MSTRKSLAKRTTASEANQVGNSDGVTSKASVSVSVSASKSPSSSSPVLSSSCGRTQWIYVVLVILPLIVLCYRVIILKQREARMPKNLCVSFPGLPAVDAGETPLLTWEALVGALGADRNLSQTTVRTLYNCLLNESVLSYFRAQYSLPAAMSMSTSGHDEAERERQRQTDSHVHVQASAIDACAVARAASNYRSLVKRYSRSRGSYWDEQLLKMRDWYIYGWNGATFELLLQRYASAGNQHEGNSKLGTKTRNSLGAMHGVCDRITLAAFRTNSAYNMLMHENDDE